MANQDAVIRLLLIEDRLDEAEALISMLRNGGIAVRPSRAETADELDHMLAAGGTDLVLASARAKVLTLQAVLERVARSGKDLPVLAVIDEFSDAAILQPIAAGARGVVHRNKPEHLQFIVRKEFAMLDQRRAMRRVEAMLRETERRCDALIDSSRDPIAYVHEGMHIRANRAYLDMFGYEGFEEIEGLPVLDMIAGGPPAEAFKGVLKALSKGEAPPKSMELKAQRADGETFDAVMEFAPASYEGEPCLQIIFHQRTIDAEMARELDELRQRDLTTGLYNRQHFTADLDTVVAEAAGGASDRALFLLELDNYAALLGEIGLTHADELLKQAAARLIDATGALGEVLLSRIADHTFAITLRGADHTRTREVGEAIRAAFHGHILEAGERSLSLTVSLGGVQIGEKIASVPQVLGKAAQSLQSAQSGGGNRVEVFDPGARDRAEEERIQEWVARIKHALRNNEFLLHYQPVIGLMGNEVETYEVLVRMRVGSGDIVPPLSFLSIAEEHGLLDDIDRWVVARAIQVLAEQHKAGHRIALIVKITPQALTESGNLGLFVTELLKRTGAPGQHLIFEIPESKAFTNLRPLQEFLGAVARAGCQLCLSQFGAGLNSFQLLEQINASVLKIDRSFTSDLGKNPEGQKKLRELAGQAQKLGKRTIAEHVSDAATLTVLYSSNVDFVEGHFLAAAGPELNYDFSAF